MKKIQLVFLLSILTSFSVNAQKNGLEENSKIIQDKCIYLVGDVIKVPLVMIRDLPFIEGEINGVKGRWMFDTGNAEAFSLHSKKVTGVESEVFYHLNEVYYCDRDFPGAISDSFII